MLAEEGLVVEDGLKEADLKIGGGGDFRRGDHADELFLAEWDDDACAAQGGLAVADGVGKDAVDRHGECDFAAGRHGGRKAPV